MNRCTVCGAISREGAKYCTSCGTPLVDETQEQAATTLDSDADPASRSPAETTVSGGAREEAAADSGSSSSGGQYASSWPGADSPDEEERATADADQEVTAGDTLREESPWPRASTASPAGNDDDKERVITAPAPPSFATDAYQDPDRPRTTADEAPPWPSTSPATDDEDNGDEDEQEERIITAPAPSTFATDADQDPGSGAPSDDDDDNDGSDNSLDHRGASEWEGWAPAASGPSTASNSFNEHLDHARKLIEELQHRLERLGPPASLASRELDPDDLADQLERWSRAMPNSDELFEIVQTVRRSPRDIDAMVRLADHAADLELLVRHYQSITSTSDQWAADLRRSRDRIADA